MASFLRGKQAGVQGDLSAGLQPGDLNLDHATRCGINSQVGAFAYDPVQSLLAVGTNDSKFGAGQVYVFGQKRVCAIFATPRKASITTLQFCADKLICVDSKNDLCVFSLETKRLLVSYAPPGRITAVLTDPTMDYALIGLQNGEIIAYDLDRQGLAPLRIPNLWSKWDPRAKLVSVVTLAMHPRDIGTLLIAYSEGAVLYSFKQNKAVNHFQYLLPPGAPGGLSDPSSAKTTRSPRLVQAAWHPTGTFFLTGHDDSSIVVWDIKTAKVVQARTVQDSNVDQPESVSGTFGSTPGTFSLKAPLFRIAWCAKQNPDDTGILVAGGVPTNIPNRGLTFLDLGQTPVYATSSWQILSNHVANPKRQHVLQTPPNVDVVDFCLIPKSSPHFAGAQDPIAVLALLSSGEVVTLSFPSGHPITPTNQLHASLTFVHPFVTTMALACIDRTRWLGMTEKRQQGPPILNGGAEATRPLKRFEKRNVLHTAHADGTIRIWDAGHGDEIENEDLLQVDVARALQRAEGVEVSTMSMSGATGELAVGLRSGELVIFRWGRNQHFGQSPTHIPLEAFGLEDVQDCAEPGLKEGLLPFTLLPRHQGSVTAACMSDVGFVAAGFEDGGLVVIDLRGPAVIFEASLQDLVKPGRSSSIRRNSTDPRLKQRQGQANAEHIVKLEFGVMNLEGENYSSILLFAGTNSGQLLTFKLLPEARGGYTVQFAGSTLLEGRVVDISPMHADTGLPAYCSQGAVASLRTGLTVNGVLLVTTHGGARVFKPATSKGAHKSWSDYLCDSAQVVRHEHRGTALLGLFGDGNARIFSIPGLKEIAATRVDMSIDPRRFSEAFITPTGDVFGWNGPSEITVLHAWGTGQDLTKSADRLFDPEAPIPPRPTISNMQWISGTQYVTPSDLDVLIGGSDRPPSKRMIEQMRSEEQQRRAASRSDSGGPLSSSSPPAAGGATEGYWGYMQRQIAERTEKLNIMGDSMDNLEESSSKWTDDVNKFVGNQKKKAVMGLIGSKLGF